MILKKLSLFKISLLFFVLAILSYTLHNLFEELKIYNFPENTQIAVWVWDDITTKTPESQNKLLADLESSGINRLYVNIDQYLALTEIKFKEDAITKIEEYKSSLSNFIKSASSKHFKVEALVGSPTWCLKENSYIIKEFLRFYTEYNSKFINFDGMHFNIEPYNIQGFEDNSISYYTQYLDCIDYISNEFNSMSSQHKLGVTLPFWSDGMEENSTNIFWDGNNLSITKHVINILKKRTNNYIAILNYRNYAYGKDGAIHNIEKTIEYISNNNLPVKIVVGQESGNYFPEKITFFGKTKNLLRRNVSEIDHYFYLKSVVEGYAINDSNSFLLLN